MTKRNYPKKKIKELPIQPIQEQKILTDSQLDSLGQDLSRITETSVQRPPPKETGELTSIQVGLTAVEAFEAEGLDFPFVARTLKKLVDNNTTSKWNPLTKQFDFFLDGELHRRCCDLIVKVLGGFAPDTTLNLNIDANLAQMLEHSSPEEANKLASKYLKELTGELNIPIDVEVVSKEDEGIEKAKKDA